MKFHAVWTALVTPLHCDYSVDFASFDRLIEEQEQADLGLLILGSTGEALNLDLNDKKKIIERAVAKATKSPLMVGVAGHDQRACEAWVDYLETLPIHSYLMVTPIYSKPSDQGQYAWFKHLFDRVSKPVMLYNVPSRAGVSLSLNAVERLSEHKNYWAIKEASGSVEKFKEYVKASRNQPVFCGDDGLFPQFAQAGSVGLVSVASNAWPKETSLYAKLCLDGKFSDHDLWSKACSLLFTTSNPVPVKRLLFDEKRIAEKTMMPPLSELDLSDSRDLVEISKQIKNWYHAHS